MTATAAQISQVRRMTAEPVATTTYADTEIQSYIEAYPLIDVDGNAPDESDWTATYDLHAAAADIWEEKAALLAADYDFTADGSTHNLAQAYEQHMKMTRYHRSRRVPTTMTAIKWPKEPADRYTDQPWIINNPEEDDQD